MEIKEELRQKIEKYLVKIYKNKIDLKQIKLFESFQYKADIISKLNSEPLEIINQIIPHIKNREFNFDTAIETDENEREEFKLQIYDSFEIDDFSLITFVSEPEYIFEGADTELEGNDVGICMNINSFNYFSGEISLKGTFVPPLDTPELRLSDLNLFWNAKVIIHIRGLLKNDIIPGWIYYLVEGCVNYMYHNEKMAIFNIFAALDNFIEDMYNEIFNFYINNYSKLLNSVRRSYPSNSKIFEEAEEHLKNKIKNFARDTKRLDEKLKEVMKEVNIKGDNIKFKKICEMYKINFKDIERIRNKIAHGEIYGTTENFGQELYFILTIILSILFVHDFENDQWKKIIKHKK